MASYKSQYTGAQIDAGINIAEAIADYVIEQGTTDGWMWRKWNSGIAECWYKLTYTSKITSGWNGLYESNQFPAVNYPFSFTELPLEFVTPGNNQDGAWVEVSSSAQQTLTSTNVYQLIRPAKVETEQLFTINLYVVGKWK